MKFLSISLLILFFLAGPTFGSPECPRGKEAKEMVTRYMKEIHKTKDFLMGASSSLQSRNPSEKQFCRYNIYITWMGLNDQGDEQVYMKHFELDENLNLTRFPSVICVESIDDQDDKSETSDSLSPQEEICWEN